MASLKTTSLVLVFFNRFGKGTDRCDGSYLDVHAVLLFVFSLASRPGTSIQLHRLAI